MDYVTDTDMDEDADEGYEPRTNGCPALEK